MLTPNPGAMQCLLDLAKTWHISMEDKTLGVYEKCNVLENENYLLRLVEAEDCEDLLKVYSDKNALPFFNSDNCDGDNFYYATKERMAEAFGFWKV